MVININMVVYKYPLDTGDDTVYLPRGAKVLSFQFQDRSPFIWAMVDPNEQLEPRKFKIYGTGIPILFQDVQYIGTTQEGSYVWHLFEILNQIVHDRHDTQDIIQVH